MSHTTVTAELAAELITAITGIDEKSDPENFGLCRAFTLKNIRQHPYTSTNKFAVREQLDGLEEKFRVLQNEQLADELQARRQELTALNCKVESETLHLFLELSSNPLSQVDDILDKLKALSLAAEAAAERAAKQEEEWKTFNGDDSGEEQGLWDVVDFAANSSDEEWNDDDEAVFSKMDKDNKKKPAIVNMDDADNFDSFDIEDYIEPVKRTNLTTLENSQYWSTQNLVNHNSKDLDVALIADLQLKKIPYVSTLSEIHIIREVIFMLYGLPCSLYELREGDVLSINSSIALRHTSVGVLTDVLEWFSLRGTKLRKLRSFTTQDYGLTSEYRSKIANEEAMASRRSFVAQIEAKITKWEQDILVPVEEMFVMGQSKDQHSVLVSLIDIQQRIEPTLKPFLILYEIVEKLSTESKTLDSTERGYRHLELLFDCACELQALGDIVCFKFITEMFFPCLDTYLRPIIWWMEAGELRGTDGEGAFFVEATPSHKPRLVSEGTLATLWHDRYVVKKNAYGLAKAPKFMQADSQNIYVTGKSVLLLRRLQGQDFYPMPTIDMPNMILEKVDFETACSSKMLDGSLTAFEDLFAEAFTKWVSSVHAIVSKEVRDVLYYDCGLFDTLECLADVYFMRDGYAATSFCTGIFDKIEKGRDGWDDRFLLTELLQSVFVDNNIVDISRLAVRNSQTGTTKVAARLLASHRSIKSLSHITADYKISWPVMNVVGVESLDLYRKIWTFLLMVRRVKSVLQKIRLKQGDHAEVLPPGFYLARWKLVSFVALTHAYITDIILSPQSEQMKAHLSKAADVDGMIDIHQKYILRVHDLCLLGSQFAPLYQAMISIFDLALVFADNYTVRVLNKSSFEVSNRSLRNVSNIIRPTYKKRQHSESVSDDDNSDSDGEISGRDDEGTTTTADNDDDDDDSDVRIEEKVAKLDHSDETIDADMPIVSESESYGESMERMSDKFDQLLGFLIAGLKSVARAGVYPEQFDVLAERLELGAVAGGMRSQEFEWTTEE